MSNDTPQPSPDNLLPEGKQAFRVWEVAQIINHSDQQVNDLIDSGAFGAVVNCGTGKKRSLVISRDSLITFLQRRQQ